MPWAGFEPQNLGAASIEEHHYTISLPRMIPTGPGVNFLKQLRGNVRWPIQYDQLGTMNMTSHYATLP